MRPSTAGDRVPPACWHDAVADRGQVDDHAWRTSRRRACAASRAFDTDLGDYRGGIAEGPAVAGDRQQRGTGRCASGGDRRPGASAEHVLDHQPPAPRPAPGDLRRGGAALVVQRRVQPPAHPRRRTVISNVVRHHPNGSCAYRRCPVPRDQSWSPHLWHKSPRTRRGGPAPHGPAHPAARAPRSQPIENAELALGQRSPKVASDTSRSRDRPGRSARPFQVRNRENSESSETRSAARPPHTSSLHAPGGRRTSRNAA